MNVGTPTGGTGGSPRDAAIADTLEDARPAPDAGPRDAAFEEVTFAEVGSIQDCTRD